MAVTLEEIVPNWLKSKSLFAVISPRIDSSRDCISGCPPLLSMGMAREWLDLWWRRVMFLPATVRWWWIIRRHTQIWSYYSHVEAGKMANWCEHVADVIQAFRNVFYQILYWPLIPLDLIIVSIFFLRYACIALFHPETYLFTNCSIFDAYIMVLPLFSFVLHLQ